MTDAHVHECETSCGRPAPTTRMCWDCVQEITDALERGKLLRAALRAIARREVAPLTLRSDGGGRAPAGPSEPMNLTALAIDQDITAWLVLTAADWSQVDRAAWWHHWIPARVQMAVDMTEGEAEAKPSAAYVRYKIQEKGALDLMPVGTATKWLARYGIEVDKKRVGMWASRGKIYPDGRGPEGTALYRPATIVAALYPTRSQLPVLTS